MMSSSRCMVIWSIIIGSVTSTRGTSWRSTGSYCLSTGGLSEIITEFFIDCFWSLFDDYRSLIVGDTSSMLGFATASELSSRFAMQHRKVKFSCFCSVLPI